MPLLTPAEIGRIKKSFDALLEALENDTDLAHRIYIRLFELSPESKAMFNTRMNIQEEKLVAMLSRLIGALSDETKLTALVMSLGKTHKDYGVKAHHYVILKQAITMAFLDVAPTAFDAPTVDAWSKAYDAVANGMMAVSLPPA